MTVEQYLDDDLRPSTLEYFPNAIFLLSTSISPAAVYFYTYAQAPFKIESNSVVKLTRQCRCNENYIGGGGVRIRRDHFNDTEELEEKCKMKYVFL